MAGVAKCELDISTPAGALHFDAEAVRSLIALGGGDGLTLDFERLTGAARKTNRRAPWCS
jgi:hypothetical protein